MNLQVFQIRKPGSDWAWGWLDFLIVFSSMWEIGIDLASRQQVML